MMNITVDQLEHTENRKVDDDYFQYVQLDPLVPVPENKNPMPTSIQVKKWASLTSDLPTLLDSLKNICWESYRSPRFIVKLKEITERKIFNIRHEVIPCNQKH